MIERLGDLYFLFPAIRAKGNGFAMGECIGPDVVRSHVFLRVRLGGAR